MSGYFLYQSSSLESFPRRFPELFVQENPLSDPVYIVVQNKGLGEWLVRYLAEKTGAVMGPRILMPEQALRSFAGEYSAAKRILAEPEDSDREGGTGTGTRRGLLFMDGMKLTLFKALEEVLSGSEAVFAPLRHYLEDGGEERLWQLSDALAGIFYHYGMNCLPLVEAWEKDRRYSGILPDDELSEAWQRRLWRRVFHEDAPYTHLSRVLSEVMASGESIRGGGNNGRPPGRILLFGSMFLGETGLRFFRYLARDFDVHHFLLTPSRSFAEISGGFQGELFSRQEAEGAFLRGNGRLSSGFASLLPDLVSRPPDENWDNPGTPGTVLHRLRASLIGDSPFSGPANDDGSLSVHNVTGPRRSVEILKDRILEALRDDGSLAPTQIGVLAPDISRFAPYIETVFPSRGAEGEPLPGHLTFNITDLPARSEAPYPSAFRMLTELPGSRFGRGALISLFTNPCFYPSSRKPETAAEWRRFVDTLHIRWGTDGSHRGAEGAADRLTGSWEAAFERLLAGYYYQEGDVPEILPAYLAGDGDADTAGELIHTVRALDQEIRGLDSRVLPLREWTLLWEGIADRWLAPRRDGTEGDEDESDRLRIKAAIRDLMALSDDVHSLEDFGDGGIPWVAFSSLLSEMTNPSSGRRGRYLARGVTCASLKPMRAIPFRRIYVLGMDEGAWPGREYLTGFDLRDRVPGSIDLSRESVDRFAFLEILFSAEEHISFFYTGRDPERGDSLSPAVPVVELLEHLGEGADSLVRRHPLNPFHSAALTGSGPLATSSPEALSLAEARYRGTAKPEDKGAGPVSIQITDSIDWQELVSFLKNPVAFFYHRVLGAARESGEEDLSEDDSLEADFLDWWKWRSSHISGDIGLLRDPRRMVNSFRDRLHLEGALSYTAVGILQSETLLEDAERLASGLDRLVDEGLDTGPPFSCRFVPGSALPEAGIRPGPGSVLNLPAPAVISPDGKKVYITGLVEGLHILREGGEDGKPDIWTLLDFISGRTISSRHNLESWIVSVLIGASLGRSAPAEIRIFRLSPEPKPARRYQFGIEDAGIPGSGELVRLADPPGLLNSLFNLYAAEESSPLAMYPELADRLGAMDLKEPVADRLESAAAEAWNSIISNTRTYSSTLRDCRFRQRFLSEPDFGTRSFKSAWDDIYGNGGLLK